MLRLPGLRVAFLTIAAACLTSCWSNDLTSVSPEALRPSASVVPQPALTVRGCAALTISLKNKRVGSAAITPTVGSTCDAGLRIVLSDTVQYDYASNVVRVPIALVNGGAHALAAPAWLSGLKDSLFNTSNGNGHQGPLQYVAGDSSTAAAQLWSYANLLNAGQPGVLLPGARSGTRVISIVVVDKIKDLSAVLIAEAAARPAAPITVTFDAGVTGTLLRDTAAYVGDAIAYAYSTRTGYADLDVRVDGLPASAAGVIRADTVPHVISVTTDRAFSVPAGMDALFATATAVRTASDVPAAYQQWLDASQVYLDHAPDRAAAQRGLDIVAHLAFDDVAYVAEMARVENALANHQFSVAPAGGALAMRGVPGGPSRLSSSVVQPQGDTVEATTFLYVNGIHTTFGDAGTTSRTLDAMVRSIPGLSSPKISTTFFYNRNRAATPPTTQWRYNRCVMLVEGNRYEWQQNAIAQQMSVCMQDTSYRRWQDIDLVESVRQVVGILRNINSPEPDADTLAQRIQEFRTRGRHVIVMAHSQGNLMTNEALHSIALNPQAGLDSTCIGVVSMASPTSSRWDVPDHNLAKIVVEGDRVPMIANGNTWPAISTALGRAVRDSATRIGNPFTRQIYLDLSGYSTLHSVDNSYLKDEAGQLVLAGIQQTYGACAVARMSAAPVTVNVGNSFYLTPRFENVFGDVLSRTVPDDQFTIADTSILGAIGGGSFRARKRGTTAIALTHGGRSATAPVAVLQPGSIVGDFSGSIQNLDKGTTGSMQISIAGGPGIPSTITARWNDAAQSYMGLVSGANVVRGNGTTAGGQMPYTRLPCGCVTFSRIITLELDGNDPDHVTGSSYDIQFGNFYLIDLRRNAP